MTLSGMDGLGWLLLMLGPLLVCQRTLHRELQKVLLLTTRRADVTLSVFSLLFLPGVLLHEASHFIVAKILRVRTGRFSLLPRPLANGKLQMGYVEVAKTDIGRDALIGLAPLVSGMIFIAYVGLLRMDLFQTVDAVRTGQMQLFWSRLAELPSLADFWIWFYLVFAVSSTMFPSASDRRAWLPVLLIVALLLSLVLLAGAGTWLFATLGPTVNQTLRVLSVLFAISLVIHLFLLFPFWILRVLLSRITGYRVV